MSENVQPLRPVRAQSLPGFPRGRRWRKLRRPLSAGLGLVAIIGLVWSQISGRSDLTDSSLVLPAAQARESSLPRVDVIRPVLGGIRRLTIQPGTIHAFESVDLYAKVSGFLKTQAVDIGSVVKRGQILAEIDAPELERDVEEAAAAVEQAKAQVQQAVSRLATAQAEQGAAAAAVAEATTDLDRLAARRSFHEKQFSRIEDLSRRDAVERKLVDEEQLNLDSARVAERSGRAAIETERARLAAAGAKVRQASADLTEARSFVKVAEARLAKASVLAHYTRILAPFDGLVTRRTYHPGAFIRSAAEGTVEPLLTVRRSDLMRVVIQVPDLDVPLLDVGDKVTIAVDALPGREFAGTVARIGKYEDPTSRTMRAEVDMLNGDGLLVEGMYGRVTIELQPPTEHLTVPAACVVGHSERGKAAVFVVRAGKVRRTPVALGGDDGKSVEVLRGLRPTDEVVVRPSGTFEDGMAVLATAHDSRSSVSWSRGRESGSQRDSSLDAMRNSKGMSER